MTDERRQDFLLVALVVSVIAHMGLMIFMKPQVMTHVTGAASRVRPRGPMVVKDAPPPAEPVQLASVRDVEALRESPMASEALLPVDASVDAPSSAGKNEAPEIAPPELAEAPMMAVEVAPHLSEKIHIDRADAAFTTPIVAESLHLSVPRTSSAAPDASPVTAANDIPLFTAPTFVPTLSDKAALETVPETLPETEGSESNTASFVPLTEVLSSVDERVVEAEKSAVRTLLNVRDARELAKFVSVVTTSATAGEWTYFRVQMNPRTTLPVIPKDVVILLDASGSIGNDRLKSCRAAARKLLRSCTNTGDRFNLVAFRDRFSYAFKSWQSCDQVGFDRADKWLDDLAAHGRTDVFAVIRSVLTLPRDPKRPLIALVVTDGEANAGVRETAQILSKFTALNDGLISVYMYGVKGTANRELIDVLTRGNRGESYIFDGFRWNAGSYIEGLCERFRDPVLSDLRVILASGSGAEVYPRRLRNFYRGGIVDFVGRVPKGRTEVSFSVKGLNGAQSYEGFFKLDLSTASFDAQLPARWENESAIDEKLRPVH